MNRTFNRKPLSVPSPSKNDVKDYFFNHANWKGMTDNKNILAIDQETFSDCNNVYINEDGLLRSRPSIKHSNIFGSNIINIWNFDVVTIVLDAASVKFNKTNGDYYYERVNVWQDMVPILVDEKIFVFSSNGLGVYDIVNNVYSVETNSIYVPIIKTYVNNILTDETHESKNLLTTKSRIRYTFDGLNYDFNTFVNKIVDLKLNGNEYNNYEFGENSVLTFTDKFTSLSDSNYSNDKALVDISENGVILKTINTSNGYILEYSVDGIIYNSLPPAPGKLIYKGKISKNGYYAFAITSYSVYVYSLVDTVVDSEGKSTKKYSTWTDLLSSKSNHSNWYESLPIVYKIYRESFNSLFGKILDVLFLSDDNFVINYKIGYDLLYSNVLLICNNDDLKTEVLDDEYGVTSAVTTSISTTYTTDNEGNKIYSGNVDVNIPYYRSNAAYKDGSTINRGSLHITNITVKERLFQGELLFQTKCTSQMSCKYNNNSLENLDYSTTDTRDVYTSDYISSSEFSPNPAASNYSKYASTALRINSQGDFVNCYAYWDTTNNKIHFVIIGGKLPINPGNNTEFLAGNPKLYYSVIEGTDMIKPLYNYITTTNYSKLSMYKSDVLVYSSVYRGGSNKKIIRCIKDGKLLLLGTTPNPSRDIVYDDVLINEEGFIVLTVTDNIIKKYQYEFTNVLLSDTMHKYLYTYVKLGDNNYLYSIVKNIDNDISDTTTLKLSKPTGHVLTNDKIYISKSEITTGTEMWATSFPLLHSDVIPVDYYYLGNSVDSIYYIKDDVIYSNSAVKSVEIIESLDGEDVYIVPSHFTELDQYYFSIDKTLYISSEKRDKNDNYLWYFPHNHKQGFDYSITNLHPISTNEVAIFFEDSIYYVAYDSELKAYRYFKTKAQVGCIEGCDVITTFDSKYTLFTSNRGLVAMSYQEFISSTEQALNYLTDQIHSVFMNYLNELDDNNNLRRTIKLYKHDFWIIVYKPGKRGFVYDVRNGSWWPVQIYDTVNKILTYENKPLLFIRGQCHILNTGDTNYVDEYGTKSTANGPLQTIYTINWYIQSQKLHLNALNYYKHISNITLVSVHDLQLLKDNDYNVNELDVKLQVNNYRKKIEGNIGKEDCEMVSYKVETIRTFIQRLNYSKVNEFQYKLSCDEKSAINIPLSLSGITIKYKVGGQIR